MGQLHHDPTAIILVAAMNPCPCGYYGDTAKPCGCSLGTGHRDSPNPAASGCKRFGTTGHNYCWVAGQLLAFDNVILTPHTAMLSEEAMLENRTRAVEEVIRVVSGQPPRNPVPRT